MRHLCSIPLAAWTKAAPIIVAAVMAASMASCHDDDDVTDIPPTPEQAECRTLLMYLPWSTNLTSYFYTNISDMEEAICKTGLTNERVLVFMCSTASAATLFELVPEGETCRRDTLKAYSSPAYTTADGIASILTDVKSFAPADRYAMTIGCHGMGWLPVNSSSSRGMTPVRKFHWDYTDGPLTRFFGGTSASTQTDITTLAEGIEAADMHMDFILFDDCYMSSIEAAYDLRLVTDYLIGCPSEIMAYGMPYAEIGPYLFGEPDYEAVCEAFLDFYSNYQYPYGTIGVTCSAELDSLAGVVAKIEAAYDFDTSLLPYLQDMDGYSPPIFYDLGDYVAALCPDTALLAEFEAQLTRAVPYRANTTMFYTSRSGAESIRVYSGITTSAPTTSQYAYDWTQTAWYAATH